MGEVPGLNREVGFEKVQYGSSTGVPGRRRVSRREPRAALDTRVMERAARHHHVGGQETERVYILPLSVERLDLAG